MTAFLQRSLTLRHLRLLLALDELRQIRRVAERLHVTQPAISKALSEIEDGVGAPLFERTPRGLTPTEQGACLIRHAQSVLDDLARADEELQAIARGVSASVSVGVMPGSSGGVMPTALLQCRQRLPGVALTVIEGPVDSLIRQLRSGRLDLVVGGRAERSVPPDLYFAPLYTEPLAVVGGASHRSNRAESPSWTELGQRTWILPPRSAPLRGAIESLWRRLKIAPPQVAVETVSRELTLTLLAREPMLAFMTLGSARRYAAAGALTLLDIAASGLSIPLGMLRLAHSPPSPAVEILEACLIEASGDEIEHIGTHPLRQNERTADSFTLR